jgi:hypothetical protein
MAKVEMFLNLMGDGERGLVWQEPETLWTSVGMGLNCLGPSERTRPTAGSKNSLGKRPSIITMVFKDLVGET